MKKETVEKVMDKLKELGYTLAYYSRNEFVIPSTHRDTVTLHYNSVSKKFLISLHSRYLPPSVLHVGDVMDDLNRVFKDAKDLNRIILEDS
ncbi:hypothetical protein [Bacillus atrophaeus]|uniref:hypothetical protein n=1 Tax=Bacillus atrophaeus TaxID=1452 RepID=UPI00227F8652|nr:hypothetical protein [Bacillus atrophaeus]MCY8466463.1 hypothetical protein [Bacillus atrophaeus]MCY8478922.1 hypothetical protein [Bacillus atrophaeus]